LVHEAWFLAWVKMDASGLGKAPFTLRVSEVDMMTDSGSVYTHTYIHTCTHTYMHTHTYIHACTHIHEYMNRD